MVKALTFQGLRPKLDKTDTCGEMGCGRKMESENVTKKFRDMLVGEYDNSIQFKREEEEGTQIHPYASHDIFDVTASIKNLPESFHGIFVIEESHFDMGSHVIDKRYLFSYEEEAEGVLLKSYLLPEGFPERGKKEALSEWFIEHRHLEISPRFEPLLLKWDGKAFCGENVSQFSQEHRFYFKLEVYDQEFYVKEMLKKEETIIAGYETPIHYLPRKEGAPCHY